MASAAVRSEAVVLLLLIHCWLFHPLWDSVIALCFAVRYFMPILVLQPFDGEERGGCFALLSSWCLVIDVRFLLMMPRVCLQFVILVFPDHTHLIIFNIKIWLTVIVVRYSILISFLKEILIIDGCLAQDKMAKFALPSSIKQSLKPPDIPLLPKSLCRYLII